MDSCPSGSLESAVLCLQENLRHAFFGRLAVRYIVPVDDDRHIRTVVIGKLSCKIWRYYPFSVVFCNNDNRRRIGHSILFHRIFERDRYVLSPVCFCRTYNAGSNNSVAEILWRKVPSSPLHPLAGFMDHSRQHICHDWIHHCRYNNYVFGTGPI